MTDGAQNFFKFQNIHLRPTRQNTLLPTEGTAEEQFQLIEASAQQQALDDLRQETQPSAPEQSQDISSTSSAEELLLQDQQAVVSTSSSSFEIVHHDDNTYTATKVPRNEDKHLKAPVLLHNIPDIWNDTDEEDETR